MLQMWDFKSWTGFSWLRTRIYVSCGHRDEHSLSIKYREFLYKLRNYQFSRGILLQ